jgi:hypothetical protein
LLANDREDRVMRALWLGTVLLVCVSGCTAASATVRGVKLTRPLDSTCVGSGTAQGQCLPFVLTVDLSDAEASTLQLNTADLFLKANDSAPEQQVCKVEFGPIAIDKVVAGGKTRDLVATPKSLTCSDAQKPNVEVGLSSNTLYLRAEAQNHRDWAFDAKSTFAEKVSVQVQRGADGFPIAPPLPPPGTPGASGTNGAVVVNPDARFTLNELSFSQVTFKSKNRIELGVKVLGRLNGPAISAKGCRLIAPRVLEGARKLATLNAGEEPFDVNNGKFDLTASANWDPESSKDFTLETLVSKKAQLALVFDMKCDRDQQNNPVEFTEMVVPVAKLFEKKLTGEQIKLPPDMSMSQFIEPQAFAAALEKVGLAPTGTVKQVDLPVTNLFPGPLKFTTLKVTVQGRKSAGIGKPGDPTGCDVELNLSAPSTLSTGEKRGLTLEGRWAASVTEAKARDCRLQAANGYGLAARAMVSAKADVALAEEFVTTFQSTEYVDARSSKKEGAK